MTHTLAKYESVNNADSKEELFEAMRKLADEYGFIQGRSRRFDVETMIRAGELYFEDKAEPNVFTREFGIRQQAMYLKYYNKC